MSNRVTGPLFKWFGSKWLSSKRLPRPIHSVIIEPFAGGAGYSLRHSDSTIIICESNQHIQSLWSWLINEATEHDVRAIPLDLKEGIDIRSIGLNRGQTLLLKNWQRTNNVGNCWTTSVWGNKPGQWTANTRARVAEEIACIKHWKVYDDAWACMEVFGSGKLSATWFIDPPYQYNYQYGSVPVDYAKLSQVCNRLPGQIIVCEAVCPKTQSVPQWLPFQFFGNRITSRRKQDNNHHSKELVFHR